MCPYFIPVQIVGCFGFFFRLVSKMYFLTGKIKNYWAVMLTVFSFLRFDLMKKITTLKAAILRYDSICTSFKSYYLKYFIFTPTFS